jgi:hypothetical protein
MHAHRSGREPFARRHRSPVTACRASIADRLAQLAAGILVVIGRGKVDLRRIVVRIRRHLYARDSTSLRVEHMSGDHADSARRGAEIADIDRREDVSCRAARALAVVSVAARVVRRVGAGRGGRTRGADEVVHLRPGPAADRPIYDSRRAPSDTEDRSDVQAIASASDRSADAAR